MPAVRGAYQDEPDGRRAPQVIRRGPAVMGHSMTVVVRRRIPPNRSGQASDPHYASVGENSDWEIAPAGRQQESRRPAAGNPHVTRRSPAGWSGLGGTDSLNNSEKTVIQRVYPTRPTYYAVYRR